MLSRLERPATTDAWYLPMWHELDIDSSDELSSDAVFDLVSPDDLPQSFALGLASIAADTTSGALDLPDEDNGLRSIRDFYAAMRRENLGAAMLGHHLFRHVIGFWDRSRPERRKNNTHP